jgi:hypothetical protein
VNIKIDGDDSLCDKILANHIHHHLESGWTVGETKVHHQQLKQASICVEGGLPLITLSDVDIILSLVDIKLSEIA